MSAEHQPCNPSRGTNKPKQATPIPTCIPPTHPPAHPPIHPATHQPAHLPTHTATHGNNPLQVSPLHISKRKSRKAVRGLRLRSCPALRVGRSGLALGRRGLRSGRLACQPGGDELRHILRGHLAGLCGCGRSRGDSGAGRRSGKVGGLRRRLLSRAGRLLRPGNTELRNLQNPIADELPQNANPAARNPQCNPDPLAPLPYIFNAPHHPYNPSSQQSEPQPSTLRTQTPTAPASQTANPAATLAARHCNL